MGNTGTLIPTATDPCAHLIDAPHRIPRWNVWCITVIILCATPSLSSAKSLLRRETGRDTDSAKSSGPCPSIAHEPNSVFKRGGPAVISVSVPPPKSPVRIVNPDMPAVCEKSTSQASRIQLFFVLGAVQTLPDWIFADYGSVRNLIDEAVYRRLLYKPSICDEI